MRNKILYKKEIEDLFRAKDSFHKELAKIPFDEKIKMLVRLQKVANSIPTSSRKKRRIWKIP